MNAPLLKSLASDVLLEAFIAQILAMEKNDLDLLGSRYMKRTGEAVAEKRRDILRRMREATCLEDNEALLEHLQEAVAESAKRRIPRKVFVLKRSVLNRMTQKPQSKAAQPIS